MGSELNTSEPTFVGFCSSLSIASFGSISDGEDDVTPEEISKGSNCVPVGIAKSARAGLGVRWGEGDVWALFRLFEGGEDSS